MAAAKRNLKVVESVEDEKRPIDFRSIESLIERNSAREFTQRIVPRFEDVTVENKRWGFLKETLIRLSGGK